MWQLLKRDHETVEIKLMVNLLMIFVDVCVVLGYIFVPNDLIHGYIDDFIVGMFGLMALTIRICRNMDLNAVLKNIENESANEATSNHEPHILDNWKNNINENNDDHPIYTNPTPYIFSGDERIEAICIILANRKLCSNSRLYKLGYDIHEIEYARYVFTKKKREAKRNR